MIMRHITVSKSRFLTKRQAGYVVFSAKLRHVAVIGRNLFHMQIQMQMVMKLVSSCLSSGDNDGGFTIGNESGLSF